MAADIIHLTAAGPGANTDGSDPDEAFAVERVLEDLGQLVDGEISGHADKAWGPTLRELLDTGLAELEHGDDELFIPAARLRSVHGCEGAHLASEPFVWSARPAVRVILRSAYELVLDGADRPGRELLSGIVDAKATGRDGHGPLTEYLAELPPDERDALIAGALEEFDAVRPVLDRIPRAWKPRVAPPHSLRFGRPGAEVTLHATSDILIGPQRSAWLSRFGLTSDGDAKTTCGSTHSSTQHGDDPHRHGSPPCPSMTPRSTPKRSACRFSSRRPAAPSMERPASQP
jgi:hypothetical protein